jgi:ankyrin repeat protein
MSDALPLPPRPNLEQYKKLARDLQHACKASEADAVRDWAARWVDALARLRRQEMMPEVRRDVHHEAQRLARRWDAFATSTERISRCLLADAQFFVAREHGFASWPKFAAHIETLTRRHSRVWNFEAAADAIADGDLETLQKLLRDHPELARARSTREHRSTLLHYVSANGIEDFRQRTPPNIVEITRVLLDAGADVNAESEAYGGGSTTLGLAATSIHPEQAGVQIALLELLMSYGAHVEHPGLAGNKHSAVRGCLANGQGQAAEFFANRGAHMDLEEAAGVGRLDVVRTFFDENGALRSGATKGQLESGFFYACGYGRLEVVKFLLQLGVDAGVQNRDGQTGLHWATFGPHLAVAELLLQRGAPVDLREKEHDGTPLEWAIYHWAKSSDAGQRERGLDMVTLLARAGAKADVRWLESLGANELLADERLAAALRGETVTRSA